MIKVGSLIYFLIGFFALSGSYAMSDPTLVRGQFLAAEMKRRSHYQRVEREWEELQGLNIGWYARLGKIPSDSVLLKIRNNGKNASKASHAACTRVDLRGPPLDEVRSQDSVGWCFAYAAADLLSYKTKVKVSAVDVAANYYAFEPGSRYEKKVTLTHGGYTRLACNRALARGLCLEKDVRSSDFKFSADPKYLPLLEAFREIEDYKFNQNDGPQYFGLNVPAVKKVNPNACRDLYDNIAKVIFPSVDFANFEKIINTSKSHDVISKLLETSCNRFVPMNKTEFIEKKLDNETTHDDLIALADKQLTAKNVVGFSYHGKVLYERDAPLVGLAKHASVLVGRRFNVTTGACEYLIRNSWGKACNSYDKSLDCENGNIWVPQELLAKTISDVTYAPE